MNWQAFSLSFAIGVSISTVYFNSIGAYRVALLLCGVLGILALIQLLLLRRAIKRQIQAEHEWLVRITPELEQAIEVLEQGLVDATRRRGLDKTTRAEMRRMHDEIRQAQQERGV